MRLQFRHWWHICAVGGIRYGAFGTSWLPPLLIRSYFHDISGLQPPTTIDLSKNYSGAVQGRRRNTAPAVGLMASLYRSNRVLTFQADIIGEIIPVRKMPTTFLTNKQLRLVAFEGLVIF